MPNLRAFIAVDISPETRQAIETQTSPLRRTLGNGLVRWVPSENLHLTLKFLGDISPAQVDPVTDLLTAEAATVPAFSMRAGTLGSFPTPKRARVIWVGLDAPAVLETLQQRIESVCARLGFPPEERPFSPHLTLGRVCQPISGRDQQTVQSALERTRISDLGVTEVTAVHLYKSDLRREGALYTRLFSAPLK